MNEQTIICPTCDNVIETDEEVREGDLVVCSNFPCFFQGVVDDVDSDGNVFFEEGEEDDDE